VVQIETSKISGCIISMQAAVHPGALATGTRHLNIYIYKYIMADVDGNIFIYFS
jgi:hypothetical protein